MLKLIKFGGFGGHVPYAKNPLFKILKRETESFPCDIHFIFGKDSWVRVSFSFKKLFWSNVNLRKKFKKEVKFFTSGSNLKFRTNFDLEVKFSIWGQISQIVKLFHGKFWSGIFNLKFQTEMCKISAS